MGLTPNPDDTISKTANVIARLLPGFPLGHRWLALYFQKPGRTDIPALREEGTRRAIGFLIPNGRFQGSEFRGREIRGKTTPLDPGRPAIQAHRAWGPTLRPIGRPTGARRLGSTRA